MRRMVLVATTGTLAASLALSGCALLAHPELTVTAPVTAASACTPADAVITVGRGREGDRVVIASATQQASDDGSVVSWGSSDSQQAIATVSVEPQVALDYLGSVPTVWESVLAARAIELRRAETGWADHSQLTALAAHLATGTTGDDVAPGTNRSTVISAPTLEIDFVIDCGGTSVAVSLSAPDPTVISSASVDCTQPVADDSEEEELARQSCQLSSLGG